MSNWFDEWLKRESEGFTGDPKDKLLLFFYLGHGSAPEGGHTILASNGKGLEFNLTVQRWAARDDVPFDILFGLECCYGYAKDVHVLHPKEFEHNKIMETVAAGKGLIFIGRNGGDWSQLFAAQLKYEWERGIDWLDMKTRLAVCGGMLGVLRRNAGIGSIVLPHLKKPSLAQRAGNYVT